MNSMVFLEGGISNRQFWEMIAWCKVELNYNPETQVSDICKAFKFRSDEDAMAFKLRWM